MQIIIKVPEWGHSQSLSMVMGGVFSNPHRGVRAKFSICGREMEVRWLQWTLCEVIANS